MAAVLPLTTAVLPTIAQRLGRLRGLLQRDQRRQRVVGVELLLDAGEFDQLLGELVGVERIERVLVLQLRRQQRQEALEIAGDLLRRQRVGRRGRRGARRRRPAGASFPKRRRAGVGCSDSSGHVRLLKR